MNPFKLYGGIGLALVLVLAIIFHLAGDGKVSHQRDVAQASLKKLEGESATVLKAIRVASDNPKLKWADAAGQAELVGKSRKAWKEVSELQSAKIDALGEETARAKAEADRLRRSVTVQLAQREATIRKLQAQAQSPGEQGCVEQLAAAEAALDAAYEAGL